MVTSGLVSGGKQDSGATVGVNWRCSGEQAGLDGGPLWLPSARIRAGWMEALSGVRIWPRTEETGMSTSNSQVLLRHPLRVFYSLLSLQLN